MATGADVRDILELTGGDNDGPITKKDLINSDKVRLLFMFVYVCLSLDLSNTGVNLPAPSMHFTSCWVRNMQV